MSFRDQSLKELRALAQQRLGARGAELKTRDELVKALERSEAKQRKSVPRAMVPLASPLPPSLDCSRDERIAPPAVSVTPVIPRAVEGRDLPKITAPAIEQPSTVTNHFFLDPQKPRLPAHYEDDQVLAFSRDPGALYASWDFSASQFDHGAASGQVVTEQGTPVRSFAVAGPSGGAFVEELPPGVRLKVEVRRAEAVLGASDWLVLPAAPKSEPEEVAPSSSLWPTDRS